LESAGYQVVLAEDGRQAVDLFSRENPDLVLLDIIMPEMSGIEAAAGIRARAGNDRYVPIIFVTGAETTRYLEECTAAGGDDFIAKSAEQAVLYAKIKAMLRVVRLYQEQYEKQQQLENYKQLAEREQQVAASLYDNYIKKGFVESPNLKYLQTASSSFNGDVLLSARTPSGLHYILLGDFTGHGLCASIGVGPTAEVFYGMAKKGFGVYEIIMEINRKLFALLPVDMFFGACFVCMDGINNTLTVSTGGLPDHYLLNSFSGEIRNIVSTNLPLGIVDSNQFDPTIQRFDVNADDLFYTFSDGVIETENIDAKQFGSEGVLSCLQDPDSASSTYFNSIQSALSKFSCGVAQQDDITLVELSCDSRLLESAGNESGDFSHAIIPGSWKTKMEFDVCTLQQVDPVPIILHLVMEIQDLQRYRDPIYIVIAELFANALEYGLLELDASIKSTPDGIDKYYKLKEQKLNALESGTIFVGIIHEPIGRGGQLTIGIEDSGKGFDYTKNTDMNSDKPVDQGIGLVKKICRSVEYMGQGNKVKAIYEWLPG